MLWDAWNEKSDFIDDIWSIYQTSDDLKMKFNTNYRTGGISVKNLAKWAKYRFGTDKSAIKSTVERCAEQQGEMEKIIDISI